MNQSEIIARMFQIREEKKQLAAREKELNEEWDNLKSLIIQKLDDVGCLSVSSNLGSATITTQIVPMTEDWDAVEAYIYENQALHLLQRRVATGAFRELHEAGIEVPGLKPLEKRDISLTSKAAK